MRFHAVFPAPLEQFSFAQTAPIVFVVIEMVFTILLVPISGVIGGIIRGFDEAASLIVAQVVRTAVAFVNVVFLLVPFKDAVVEIIIVASVVQDGT